jgi:hypothetical protein
VSALILSAAETAARRNLIVATEVQGYHCAAGYAWFFGNGKLSSCSVARDTSFGDLTVPAGSEIFLTWDAKPRFVFLAHDAWMGRYLCRGGKRAWSTALFPDGKLKTCWLATDTMVDGFPCRRADFAADVFGGGAATDFHENGALAGCKLARDARVKGRAYRRGEHIRLAE